MRIGSFLLLVVALWPSEACAQSKFATSLDLLTQAGFTALDVEGTSLSPQGVEHEPLSGVHPQLIGRTPLWGIQQQVLLHWHGLRSGVGVGVLAAPGLRVRHDRDDLRVDATSAWALPLLAEVTYAFGHPRWFRPYGGVQGKATLLSTTLSADTPGTPYRGFVYGLSARLGVVVSLNEFFYADLGGAVGLAGADAFQFQAGIGLPIPLANL